MNNQDNVNDMDLGEVDSTEDDDDVPEDPRLVDLGLEVNVE